MGIKYTVYSILGHSPVRPLQEHISIASACAEALLTFFPAVLAGQWDKAEKAYHEISDLEQKADNIKRDLRLNLPESLFMPVARCDVLELLTLQDELANTSEDIAGLVLGRRMVVPQAIAELYQAFLQRAVEAVTQAKKAIDALDDLFETGFHGKISRIIEEMLVELDHIEEDTDDKQIVIRKALFDIEKTLPPIDAMFLYRLIDWTGKLADQAQWVGAHLQLLLAK